MSRHSRQSAESTSTMKAESLVVILTCARLLVVGSLSTKNHNITDRILYGEIADPADFPYLMNLTPQGTGICGGSIISNNYVLTAAHCIIKVTCTGIVMFPSTWEESDPRRIHAAECYPHENYPGTGYFCDIAMIKTVENLVDDLQLATIPLPTTENNYPEGTPAGIVGWGLNENGYHSDYLKSGNQIIYDWDGCNHEFQHADECSDGGQCPVVNIPQRSRCAIGEGDHPAGSCVGDSGGPVIIEGLIVGVMVGTVMENDQCIIGAPTLYMNVVRFLPWIHSFLDSNGGTRQVPVDTEEC